MRHPIEPEELMAYLDGELSAGRASRVAEHFAECRECQTITAELRGVSDRLKEWRVEAPVMVAPVREVTQKRWYRHWKPWAIAAGVALIALWLGTPRQIYYDKMPAQPSLARTHQQAAEGGQQAQGPLLVHTAILSVVANNFDTARTAMDQILKRHKGYIGEMSINAEAQSARSLHAFLHIPDGQLDAAISELKALGRVLVESRTGEEVTQQSMDLDARLANARNAEQRLTELLKNRTGKLSDVLEVENQIAATRQNIEQMEAERKNLDRRIQYARIDLSLAEKYEPPAEHGALRKAAAEGYRTLADSLIGAAALVLSVGPVVLFWGAILGLPAWYAWRRYRR
jgi:hypothetical protein